MVREVKPLHVALIVKNSPAAFERDCRNMGLFSYAIPEFTWEHLTPGKGAVIDTRALKGRGFDLIFHEDGGQWCSYAGGALPAVYYAIDSTLSTDNHYLPRFEQARKADLVLVDHDKLERFEKCGRPVRRLSHCVNDYLFHPVAKTLDISFQCGGSPERAQMRTRLHDLALAHAFSYRSGAVSLQEYADNLNRAKVVVNIPRNARNRPHRVLDAMASGAAVVTAPIPDVSGEARQAGLHYLEAPPDDLPERVRILIQNMTWQLPAAMGHEWIQAHTWRVRAGELRRMLSEELGL